jgi:hypothetical protein
MQKMDNPLDEFNELASKKYDINSLSNQFSTEIRESILIKEVKNSFFRLLNNGEVYDAISLQINECYDSQQNQAVTPKKTFT